MKDTKFRILLDIHEVRSQATIPVKVGDVSCKIYITLVEGGKPYKIHENSFGVFTGKKGDDKYLFNNCVIENGIIRYDFTPQTVAAAGVLECEIRIYDEDGGVLTTPSFNIVVDERAVNDSELASAPEFAFLDEILVNEGQRIENERNRNEAFNNLGIDLEDDGEVISIVKTDIDGSQEKASFLKYAGVIPPVTATATGSAITIESSQAPLQNLKLYGKTEQDGTPTPDNPIELKSVGDSGSFEVGVYGKNLLPYPFPNSSGTSYTSNGLTFTVDEDGIITINGTSTAQCTYYIARWLGAVKYDRYVCVTTTDGINITVYKGGNWFGIGNNNALTVSAGDNLTEIYLQFGSGKTFNNAKVKVMITLEPNYDYEPYTKQSLTMPYELRSVRYANIDSWVRDEIDLTKGINTEKTVKYTFNGGEDWQVHANGFILFNPQDITIYSHYCWCDKYPQVWWHNLASSDYGIFASDGYSCFICVKDKDCSTVEEFKSKLASDPITVIGIRRTPIETPLSETELNAYRQLYTNKGNTTILSEADMEVDYYINKPNAQAIGNIHSQINKDYFKLQQAIISTGGSTL